MKPIPPEDQIRTWVSLLHKHIKFQSDLLALRHVVLEIAKSAGHERDEVAQLLDKTEKFYHQKYLEGIECPNWQIMCTESSGIRGNTSMIEMECYYGIIT